MYIHLLIENKTLRKWLAFFLRNNPRKGNKQKQLNGQRVL